MTVASYQACIRGNRSGKPWYNGIACQISSLIENKTKNITFVKAWKLNICPLLYQKNLRRIIDYRNSSRLFFLSTHCFRSNAQQSCILAENNNCPTVCALEVISRNNVLLLEIEAILWRVQNIQLSRFILASTYIHCHFFFVYLHYRTFHMSCMIQWLSSDVQHHHFTPYFLISPPPSILLHTCCSNPLWGWVTPHPTLSFSPPMVLLLPLSSFAYNTHLALHICFSSSAANPPPTSLCSVSSSSESRWGLYSAAAGS